MKNLFALALALSALVFSAPASAQVPGFVPPVFSSGAACVVGNDSFTKSLLHMDGANGGQTFIDNNRGGTAKTWTAGSTSNNSNAQVKFGTASVFFSASSPSTSILTNWLQTPQADLYPGASAFSWSGWVYNTGPTFSGAGSNQIIATFGDGNANANGAFWLLYVTTSNQLVLQINIDSGHLPDKITSTTTVGSQGWHFLYAAFNGVNTYYIAVDGALNSANGSSLAHSGAPGPYTIGASYGAGLTLASYTYPIYQDEIKYDIGIVRYTANFTPPTAPYCN